MAKKSKTTKLLSVLLALLMLTGLIPAGGIFASAATEGSLFYRVSGDTITIIGCNEAAEGEVTIPEKIEEKDVTAITLYAFKNCDKITSVILPESIKTIGTEAFADCDKLANVKIGKAVEAIGENAFANCKNLEKIEVSAENTVYSSDENGVLYNKDKTDLLVYPKANPAVTFTLSDEVTEIKNNAFENSKKVKTIILGDKVTKIGKCAFMGSESLETIVLGKNVREIGADAFDSCDKLTGFSVNAANTVFCSDEKGVLYSKDMSQLIQYPAGSTNTSYTVNSATTKINILAFAKAINLTEISLDKGVTAIEASAFDSCSNLTKVNFNGTAEEWSLVTVGSGNESLLNATFTFAGGIEHIHTYTSSVVKEATCTETGTNFYECECGRSYTETVAARGHNFTNNVCSICSVKEFILATDGVNAKITGYNGAATALVIPETVEGYKIIAVGDGAFEGKEQIVSITIPDSVKEIGSCAFLKTGYYNNTANWTDGVLYIGKFLIEASSTVSSDYTVKDGTEVIADYAFSGRTELKNITFPATLKVIGDAAFANCTNLEKVNCGVMESEWQNVVIGTSNDALNADTLIFIPAPHVHAYDEIIEEVAVTCTTDGYKISKCSCGEEKREDFTAPGHIFVNNLCSGCNEREYEYSVIGGKVTIEGCHESLSGTVNIPSSIGGYSVVAIGANAFAGNNKITSIVVPEGVTTIGEKAFADCSALTGVSISSSVVAISKNAFDGCKKLSAISVSNENTIYSVDDNNILFNKDKTELVYYPAGKTADEYEIPGSVLAVGANAFKDCTSLKKVIIPESVASIGESAFAGCNNIAEVVYAGSETEWNRITIGENNTGITNATKTFRDLSDAELAAANAANLNLVNANAATSGINITITATENPDFIGILPVTKDGLKPVVIETEGTLFTVDEDGKYIVTFEDCHKNGNETQVTIKIGEETYVIKVVFPTVDGGHDYSTYIVIEPTCVEFGCTKYICSICGASDERDKVEPLGHRYGQWVIEKDETCTEKGEKVRECTECTAETTGHFDYGTVSATGHRYVGVRTEPTCIEGGYTEYTCSKCGDTYKGDEAPAKGHTYGEWTVTTAPTCTEKGEHEKVCTVCAEGTAGRVVTEEIQETGHNYTTEVIDPTYTEEGYTIYTCENCGDSYNDDYVDAIGKINGITLQDIVLNKDQTTTIVPEIDSVGNISYEITFESKNENVVTVDNDGNVVAVGRGITQIVCTVIDSNGITTTKVCNVEVKFTILQWITWFFVDILFSWLGNLM